MLRALAVVVVAVSGCVSQPVCASTSPDLAICGVDRWDSKGEDGVATGTQLWHCSPGGSSFTWCANGCTSSGGGRDVCN